MKTLISLLLCLLLISCKQSDKAVPADGNLPWKIKILENGHTEVFGISPGNITLRDFAKRFNELADIKLFQKPDNTLFLEAYLGKVRIGRFEARLVAELDASDELLKNILEQGIDRKPTPNNLWQYNLSSEQILSALDLRVWRFMYISIADYEEKQIDFFGKPDEVQKVGETTEYRLFPEKGLVVLWDTDGKETFYYVSPDDFLRLKTALESDKKPDENRNPS